MKKAIVTLWALVPFLALAEFPVYDRAIQTTQQLQFSLDSLSQQAGFEANQSFSFQRAQLLRDISYRASELSQRVGQDVLYPLNMGYPLYQAADGLRRLQWDFDRTGQMMLSLGQVSFQMQQQANQIRMNHVSLKQMLMTGPGPQPVSANCLVEMGPLGRSSISCNLQGFGLTGFTVAVNGTPVWTGNLFPQVQSQRFNTDRRHVGGLSARYAVYVTTTDGQQQLVFQR